MVKSNITNISKKDAKVNYIFKFTVIRASDNNVCKLDLPKEFESMPAYEIELITSLLMSYFFSAEIFKKAELLKSENGLNAVEKKLIGETVNLIINKDPNTGYSFQHIISSAIRDNTGEVVVASSVAGLLESYEKALLDNKVPDDNVIYFPK
jgi:hypothetical protein